MATIGRLCIDPIAPLPRADVYSRDHNCGVLDPCPVEFYSINLLWCVNQLGHADGADGVAHLATCVADGF